MTSSRRNVPISIGILGASFALAVLLVVLRPEPPRAPQPDRTPIVTVRSAEAVDGALSVQGSGTVRPWAQVDLAPQVGGRIAWVSPAMVSGGRVDSAEVLLRIESADYDNAVRQARAQVAQDEVALLQAREEARIALREYEQFLARQPDAAASAPAASALTLREPQLAAAEAVLERSRAQLADAELALARTEVRAPFAAVIRSESVDQGGFAVAGQPMATLFAADVVELVVPLTDEEAALIPGLWALRGGQGLRIAAQVVAQVAGQRFAWPGRVDRAEAALDEQSRTLDIVVRVEQPFEPGVALDKASPLDGPPLLVGQFAEVDITGRTGDYLRLPRRALRTGDEVWWVEADSLVRIAPVAVVQRRDDEVYVEADLAPGTPVITEGISVATDGMRVRIGGGAGS